jgi:hypothetical protein
MINKIIMMFLEVTVYIYSFMNYFLRFHWLLSNEGSELDNYEILRKKKLKLWGICLFNGNCWLSRFIHLFLNNKWSHISLVLEDRDGVLYNFESSPGSFVRICELDKKINNYDGDCCLRKFNFKGPEPPIETIMKNMRLFIGKAYENNFLELVKGAFGMNTCSNCDSLFCSELVAQFLINIGLLDGDKKTSNNYMPDDFFSEVKFINASLIDHVDGR